jgi:hypothetical protein
LKKEWKYLAFLGLAVVVYLAVKLFAPRDLDWTVTYHKEDKNPFGAYIIHHLAPDIFPGQSIRHSYQTIYELYDSIDNPVNFLSFSNTFTPDPEDIKSLLKNVELGGNAFISAHNFYGDFSDTLKLLTYDYYFESTHSDYSYQGDTSELHFKNPSLARGKSFQFPRNNIHNYFSRFDSVKCHVVAVNDLDLPVTIRMEWGKGNLFLNSTPLAFTNAYALHGDNPDFVAQSLSLLPRQDLIWTEFYHVGRMESYTPLRFILSSEPLRWAYYLTVLSILIFMIFEAKRKQRIIPVIKPLTNTSLEFVETIGTLYYQHGDHKNIAEKKISFLLEYIRSKFWMNTTKITPDFVRALARRSGHPEEEVMSLFKLIHTIQSKDQITENELVGLNKKIEKFHKS